MPLVAQLQETFINHLVAPLFRSCRSAGLLPGVWVTSSEYDVNKESDGDSSTKEDESTEHSDSGVGHHRSYPVKKRLGKKMKRRYFVLKIFEKNSVKRNSILSVIDERIFLLNICTI